MSDTSSMDLDEVFDRLVCRKLASPLVRFGIRYRIKADHVTGIAGVLGFSAGPFFAFGGRWAALGALLLFLAMVLDCVDGDLARAHGGSGWLGRFYDGVADTAGTISVHVGMVVALVLQPQVIYRTTVPWLLVALFATLAFCSFSWNSGVLDGLKQRLKQVTVDDELAGVEANTWFLRACHMFMKGYVNWMHQAAAGKAVQPGDYPRFRLIQWIGPTHHHAMIVFAGLAAALWSPAAYLLYFFAACVPMNLYLLLVNRQTVEETTLAGE